MVAFPEVINLGPLGTSMGFVRVVGVGRGVRAVALVCVLTVLLVAPVARITAAAEPEVGTAVLIKNKVTGKLRTEERVLQTGLRVHRNELVRTGPQAQAEMTLDDNTKLALGPEAELLLDEYAVAAGSDTKTIALKVLKGTLRFLTGNNASKSYKIETPSATIGVRGTVFDVYIGPGGDTFVLLHQGVLEVCSQTRSCRPHRTVGRVVQATILGVVSQPMKWRDTLVPGVGVSQAFPFVGKRLTIDPVPRLTPDAITDRVKVFDQGGKAIEKAPKSLFPF
jgi:hypothetical protein